MRKITFFLVCSALVACGGGGGSSAPAQVANRAPVLNDPGALTLLEGTAAVATINASDADNNT